MTTVIEPVERLTRDIKRQGSVLSKEEGRALVDAYYQLQEQRKRLDNQLRAVQQGVDDTAAAQILAHFASQIGSLERQIVGVMDAWTDGYAPSVWAKDQKGIGPVLAAGLQAHLDIRRAHTAGAIWRFAGLDPTVKWEKGQKRPYNADLKVLCWKIGDSFVKVSGHDDALYGQLYRQRKQYELDRDEAGGNAETAAKSLARIKDAATRKVYESGHLPAGRLDLRARRWAVKIFLSHWFEEAWRDEYGTEPPVPFPIAQLGHVHKIEPSTR